MQGDTGGKIISTNTNDQIIKAARQMKDLAEFAYKVDEPTEETKKRWFFWSLLVARGKKHNYVGVPDSVITKRTIELEDDKKVWDSSEQMGVVNSIARRRAKNKVARASRKVNRRG